MFRSTRNIFLFAQRGWRTTLINRPLTNQAAAFAVLNGLRQGTPLCDMVEKKQTSTQPRSKPKKCKPNDKPRTSIKFVTHDSAGALQKALQYFDVYKINMTRLESRPSKRSNDYEFFVDFVGSESDPNVQKLLEQLRLHCQDVFLLDSTKVPWFPRKIKELDAVANQILDAGADLHSDHPGFNDATYRNRRARLAEIATNFKMGQSIPPIAYSEEEQGTWSAVWEKLMPLVEQHACLEYLRMLPLLKENCGYRHDNIPQLQDISEFLQECTGFRLRPVAGLLSARNFLYGLAFRTFFSTQYIRHHSKPLYTPEPDIVHELIGHVPLFADQDFADFSQEIGLASIGATDEQILQLSRCYWYTVEFGLCKQGGQYKAYGAGLLSSFGELEYSISGKPELRPWDPKKAAFLDYPITTYQPTYWVAESFQNMKDTMSQFSESFARPFHVRYNPYTQMIEVDRNIELEEPQQ